MVEMFLGKRSTFNIAIEPSYATINAGATAAWLGAVQKWTPSNEKNIKPLSSLDVDGGRDVSGHDILTTKNGGVVEFYPQHFRHLVFPFGVNSDSYVGGTPDVHTITGQNTLHSVAIQAGYHHTSSFGIQYLGGVCRKYEIGSSQGDYVKCTMDMVAKTTSKITTFKGFQASAEHVKKYTEVIRPPFMHHHVSVLLNSVEYKTELNQWRLSIDNQLVEENHDAPTISEPIPGIRKCEASLNLNLKSSVIWDLAELDAVTTAVITITKSATDKAVFTLNNPVLGSINPPQNVEDSVVKVNVPISCTSISPVITDDISVDYDTPCA